MGVKDLWKILKKAKRKVDIKELRGKTLAVDLSCWICQFSSVKGMYMYVPVQCNLCTIMDFCL
jgi:flap endonuclease GEN